MKKRENNLISNIVKSKKAQVWVETVIYTLIVLAIIGAALTFIRPKIREIQDKAVIEKSIELLQELDLKIQSAGAGISGDKRVVKVYISKGILEFNSEENLIQFKLDESNYFASDPGINVEYGDLILLTEKKSNLAYITLTSNYSKIYDLTYNENNQIKTFSKSSTPYKLAISNLGNDEFGRIKINLELIN